MTKVPERWAADWGEVRKTAIIADEAGIDFILPLARWRGYGGDTNPTNSTFETFTFAASLSGITEHIKLFSTVHVPFIHPAFAARSASTIDHSSNGRFGLNIVCGWSLNEFELFGLNNYQIESRYEHGKEWVEVFERMLSDEEFGHYKGRFFHLKDAKCRPSSIQRPRPKLMSAAFSLEGRAFATTYCDILFVIHSNLESAKDQVKKAKAMFRNNGKDGTVFTLGHVVCRETNQEAEDYYENYTENMADVEAVDNFISDIGVSKPLVPKFFHANRKRVAGGAGSTPLVGSPARVAEQIVAIREVGFGGIGLGFVNYLSELPFFIDKALPLIRGKTG